MTDAAAPVNEVQVPTCVVDQAVLNADTIGKMTDIGLSFFAELCGRNRGVFVLHPANGQTYGCTEFPTNFAALAGVEDKNVTLKDANAIKEVYTMQNVTAADTVKLLDYMVQMVYQSSSDVSQDLYACSVGGLARLQCNPIHSIPTIRSVTLPGLFGVPAPWVTNGQMHLDEESSRAFLTATDFDEMHALGLNTVQIPVSLDIFAPNAPPGAFYEPSGDLMLNHVSEILDMVQAAQLQAILVLVGPEDNDDAVAAAAQYCTTLHGSVVFGLTLPSAQSLGAARAVDAALKLFVPVTQGSLKDWKMLEDDDNVFAALDLSHTSSVADVASSSSEMDRMKLFYHQALACMARSPLEFGACLRHVPVFVANGFDLAIDDCHLQNIEDENYYQWTDYGQCRRFDETMASPWWHRHRQSLAARQLFAYEQGMGWSFAAWKLFGEQDGDDNDISILDSPAKLLALKHVAAAGLLPSLTTTTKSKKTGDTTFMTIKNEACLNPPVADFGLGDDTLAPTAGPPPDCGNGWWNASIQNCTYWIPPAPTSAPTPVPPPPTLAPTPCPAPEYTIPAACNISTVENTSSSNTSLSMAAGAGALAAIIVSAIVNKIFGGNSRRGTGYSEIPSHRSD